MKYFTLLFVSLSFSVFSEDLPYVNWENHPVHALDISPDKTRLAVAHTADNRVQLFDISQAYPVRLGHVKVGIDPVSVRFRDNNELWVVNHISDSVTLVDFSHRRVINTLKTDDEPFDLVFANNQAFVSCSQLNKIMVFDLDDLQDEPRVIEVKAEEPRAMTVNAEGTKVYVAAFESGNKTTVLAGGIDETTGTLSFPNNPVNREPSPYQGQNPPPNDGDGFLPTLNPDLPTPPKVSLIIKQNSAGQWLDDNGKDWTHMVSGEQAELSGRIPGWTLLDHDISVIDTETLEVSYIDGLMNIGMAIGFNAAKNQVSLVGTDAINHIRYEPILNGIFIRVNLALIDASDLSHPQIEDLNPHLDYLNSTVEQSLRDQSIGDPRGIVWNQAGDKAYISGMGSNTVIIIDDVGNRIGQITVGEGATGLALDEGRSRLYVWNHFAASLSSINTESSQVVSTTQVFNPLPEAIKQGRKFLYNTHLTSGLGQASCASCHVDARMDRLAWDLGDPSGEMKIFNQNCQTEAAAIVGFDCDDFHPMKGPMVTQTFQDIIGHEPFHWRGDRDGIEQFNGAFKSLNGDDTELTAEQMADYKAMLATITFPPNPYRNKDNTLPESIELKQHYTSGRFSPAGQALGAGNPQNGLQLYNSGLLDNVFQCGSCHTLPTGMAVNGELKLGTINAGVGGAIMPLGPMDANHLGIVSVDGSTQKSIKTPQLRNMYEKVGFEMSRSESLAGFGFLHDGAIDSVARFLSAGAFSVESDQEVADLVALMMAFSGSELENGNIPLGNTPDLSQDTHAGVGQQYTQVEASQLNESIDELIIIANSGKVELLVNSATGQNFIYRSSSQLFEDESGELFSAIGLMAMASSENPMNYTLVPLGLGTRLAFDRDGDGVYDSQEIIQGSDISDANSVGVRPATGLWYNPDRSGHGMDIQFSGSSLFILWYTYSDDSTPTWYIASASYQQDWQGDLLEVRWDSQTRTASTELVGRLSAQFNSAKSASMSWTLNGRSSAEEFVHFQVSSDKTIKQLTGTYYNPSDSGWGTSVLTQGNVQVVINYYYDSSGKARWAIGNGENNSNSQFEMTSFVGFCHDCEYVQPTGEVIGQVELQFDWQKKLVFSSSMTYPGDSSAWQIQADDLQALSNEYFDPEMQ